MEFNYKEDFFYKSKWQLIEYAIYLFMVITYLIKLNILNGYLGPFDGTSVFSIVSSSFTIIGYHNYEPIKFFFTGVFLFFVSVAILFQFFQNFRYNFENNNLFLIFFTITVIINIIILVLIVMLLAIPIVMAILCTAGLVLIFGYALAHSNN